MQSKTRQRQIRNGLCKKLPSEGTEEFDLYQRNRQQSPLLRLPPELRNRIFELVLSVGQINLQYKPWGSKKDSGRKGRPWDAIRERKFYCQVLGSKENPWAPVGEEAKDGMTLLSPVCRQLYHETVLLPYSLNAWSFGSRHVMERYVFKERKLPVMHRRAIRVMYIPGDLSKKMEKLFGGLQVVYLDGGRKMKRVEIESDTDEHRGQPMTFWKESRRKWC